MNKREVNAQLTARWAQVSPAPNRWQEMHSTLSRAPETAAYGWARRSSMICKWRAGPAHVSVAELPATADTPAPPSMPGALRPT